MIIDDRWLMGDADSDRFKDQNEARRWIEDIIPRIDSSKNVRCLWVEGARGEDKERLFHAAHIFVLPSRYRNEAQPISIIEAMAARAAVITSRVGEIEDSFNQNVRYLDEISPECVAEILSEMAESSQKRLDLVICGHGQYKQNFTSETH